MPLKDIIRLAESQPVYLQDFYNLLHSNNFTIHQAARFILRLERLRTSYELQTPVPTRD